MKICNTCKIEKELKLFFNNKNAKDGKHASCKECEKVNRKYDKEKRSELYHKSKDKNKEKESERRKKYYENNKEKENTQSKNYKIINKEKVNKIAIDHYNKNKNSIKYKEKRIKYYKNKLKSNDLYRISHYLRCSLGSYFRNGGFLKKSKTQEILGCSFIDFKIYIEYQFEPWMNWENRGLYNGELRYGWDIDHIIPISSAKTEEDIIKLNHYTNLRPLCSYINRVIKR